MISICIPTYNRSDLLRKVLISVSRQTQKPDEVIVVDNCSNDDTCKVAREFRDVKYYRHENNLGMIENWNRCIELSSQDYISIMHSDDLISPFWFEAWVDIITKNNDSDIGAFFSATFTVDQQDNPKIVYRLLEKECKINKEDTFNLLWKKNMCGLPMSGAIIFRKSIFGNLGKFDPKYGTEADTLFSLKILNHYSLYYTPKLLFAYRVHQFQSFDNEKKSKTMDKRYASLINQLNIFKQFYNLELRFTDKAPFFYKRVAFMYVAIAIFYFIFLKWDRADKYLKLTRSIFPEILKYPQDFLMLISIIFHYFKIIIFGRLLAFIKRNTLKNWGVSIS